jgi:hypothetical protein
VADFSALIEQNGIIYIMGKMNITQIDEVSWGLYVWQMPDGSLVMDDEGGYLSVPSNRGDINQILKLKKVAKHHGLGEGKPLWFSGHRQVTDDELVEQKQRLQIGLIPDVGDTPAMLDFIKEQRELGLN